MHLEIAVQNKIRPRVYAGLSPAERSEARRVRLVGAARECYGSAGLRHTTIPQICSKAGVTARHFYELFETQDALLRAVYDEICAELLAEIAPHMVLEGTISQRIRRSCAAYFAFVTSDPRRARIFSLEWVDVGPAVHRREQAIHEIFVATTLALQVQNSQIDTELLAVSLVGIAKALTAHWVETSDKPTTEAMTEHFATLWLRALRIEDAT
jgi:AcrR family transcriptional regulator